MTCKCGHPGDAHQHYRNGTDCALCDCQRLRTGVLNNDDGFWSAMATMAAIMLLAFGIAIIISWMI